MSLLPYILAYIALGIFGIAVIARIFFWTRMPIHVRWELYPVAHEPGPRGQYGGSYLEDVDWWKKPRKTSLMGELKVMIPEILFLVALKENNPKLWIRSFPFHFGLYLVIGATGLMMVNGALNTLAPNLLVGGPAVIMHWLVLTTAIGGLVLSLLGAVGLLQRRMSNPALKDMSAPADYFNLLFFIVAFGLALVHTLWMDPKLFITMEFIQGLVTFSPTPAPMMTGLVVMLMGLLVAYIPLTHMSHFIGKYFAYHAIRWNDTPNLKGGDQEKAIHEVLAYPVDWAAPHIDGQGKKSWGELATEEIKK